MYLRINSPNVVREYFDGEVVVVNLENGTYYSLDQMAAQLWLLFEQGLSLAQVAQSCASRYQLDEAIAQSSLVQFADKLLKEGLIVEHQESFTAVQGATETLSKLGVGPETFTEPTFKKYTDMQDLLLLDPIHDVDEAGWPAAKQ